MALVQSLQVPEELLQTILRGEKTRELYEITYISTIRPDPHDIDNIQAVSVVVRLWAQDEREARDLLTANPQYVKVGREDHELPIRVLVSVAPVAGSTGGGITEESMLMTAADRERAKFSEN